MFQFVDANLSKRILHEARQQQQEIEDEGGNSSSVFNKQVPKLGTASDDSGDETELQDDMDGDYFENIVRTEYILNNKTDHVLNLTVKIVINVQST
jgi:hypothetical protein